MNVREYFASIQAGVLAAPHVIQSDLSFDEVSETECYIRGILTLTGGFEFHLAEYIVIEPEIKRLKYRYHLQTSKDKLVARWDNAPHHPEVSTHPNHYHTADGKIKRSDAMDVLKALEAVIAMIS